LSFMDVAQEDGRPDGPAQRAGASQVAAGIAVSRAFGFLREMALAYFFGAGPHADVFRTALRGPNLLQNLLGEQTLSASFIPVFSRLLAQDRREDAARFAGAIFGLLVATAAVFSLVGVVLARPIVALLAPGYLGDADLVASGQLAIDRFPLAVSAVRIIFPMTGILVLSAWALGVLNSHRRFLVSYLAPSLWNAAIIAALLFAAFFLGVPMPAVDGIGLDAGLQSQLLLAACLGALVGGALQFAVQLPWVLKLLGGLRPSLSLQVEGVREALRAFSPLLAGRGAVQLSGYLDFFLASFLAAGAVAALGWAQTLYLLPISLFGMSVAAAELPELARQAGSRQIDVMRSRVERGFGQMVYLTIPSSVGLLVFGYLIIAALFRRGQFGVADNWLVYLILGAYTLGLIASSTSRLLNNVFFALSQTRKPARIAIERVVLSATIGVLLMLQLDRWSVNELLGLASSERSLFLGAVGLALGAGLSSWYELIRLSRTLSRDLGSFRLPWMYALQLLALAGLSTVPGLLVWRRLGGMSPVLVATLVVPLFGLTYLIATRVLGLARLGAWLGR
jgi:putative peptidoglycan lipid II flippase